MKNKIKKSLSLMLAVLMVLSCWVWVAPEKAEAASAGSYYVEVVWWSNATDSLSNSPQFDGNDDGSSSGFKIEYISDNGYGTTTGSYIYDCRDKPEKTDNTASFTVPGFPTKIYAECDGGSIFASDELRIKAIRIGKNANYLLTVFNGVMFLNSSTKCKNVTFDYNGTFTTNDGDNGKMESANTAKWGLPKPSSIGGLGGTTNITIPEVGSTSVKWNSYTATVYDQYGVSWYNSANFVLSQTEDAYQNGDMSDESSGLWWVANGSDGATVKVSEQMEQTYSLTNTDYNNGVTARDYYLVAYLSEKDGTAVDSQKLHITYPRYDWNFNTTVSGSSYVADKILMQDGSACDLDGNGTPDSNINATDYLAYNQKSTIYPLSAEKAGFTFLGFWSKQQPGSMPGEKGDPFSYEADFAYPMSTAEYNALTDDEKAKYCDAGEKWDPKTDSSQLITTGNKTYYAWWVAKDISVKFYEIDGRFIKEETVKYGNTNRKITWPTPSIQSYESGPFTYSRFNNYWLDTNGDSVYALGHTFTKDLILTPKYEDVEATMEYSINVQSAAGANLYSNTHKYRDDVAAIVTARKPGTVASDAQYHYNFVGWSTIVPASGNYHVINEDSDFDAAGHAISPVENFIVRESVTYYPIYRKELRSYDVSIRYREVVNGSLSWTTVEDTFYYGEAITAPESTLYSYAYRGFEYKLTGWIDRGDNSAVEMGKTICTGEKRIQATYDEGTATEYNVSFIYRDKKGAEVTKVFNVKHGQRVTKEMVDALNPYDTYDDGTQQRVFKGNWDVDGEIVTTDRLTSLKPETHTTIKAVYEEGLPFYTVTYKDGSNTKSYRITSGEPIPAWEYEVATGETDENGDPIMETKTYLPTRPSTDDGAYTFIGWYDAEEGGNLYVPNETAITGNVTLYPQFSFGKFEYHIEFLNWDGTLLKKGTFNYLDSFTEITYEAEKLAVKAADKVYTYQFLGWDHKVPEFCEGGEPDSTITFIAQYKPIYIYYDVEWFNDEAAMNADTEENPTELKTSKYVYGDRIFTPSVTLTPPTGAPDGQSYVFAGWYYKDAEGNAYPFTRNVKVEGNMKLYATYTLTNKLWTVTVDDGTNEPYSFTVEDGKGIKDLVSDPIAGYVDASKHNAFTTWTTEKVGGTEFDIETATITSNITIYANFAEGNHVYDKSEVVEEPSYPTAELHDKDGNVLVAGDDGKGTMAVWCECDKVKTKKTEDIAALTDSISPTGTAYVGTQWTGSNGAGADTVYANDSTDLIITTSDKGDVIEEKNEDGDVIRVYNAAGKGIGVDTILLTIKTADGATVVTEDEVVYSWSGIQTSLIAYYGSWDKVPAAYKDYNANVSLKVGGYKESLEYGDVYVATYTIIDKTKTNVTTVVTAPFLYDAKKPVATFTNAIVTEDSDKFCENVTITVTEDNIKSVTANGTALTANAEGKYVIDTAGYYNVVVEDKAGNKFSKYIEVFAAHTFQDYRVDPTCLSDGHTSQKCTVCGYETEIVDIPTTGHDTTTKHTAPTCEEYGYDTITCSKCDLLEIVDVIGVDDEGNDIYKYPATGHNMGTGTVVLKPTCTKVGERYFVCANGCGHTAVEEIPVDTVNGHYFYPAQVVKAPTCTETGISAEKCRYCYELLNETVIPATGHTYETDNDAHYSVTLEPTCVDKGSATLVCQVCNVAITDAEGNVITKEIPATGNHTYVLVKDTAPYYDAEGNAVNGERVYECSVCKDKKTFTTSPEARYDIVIYDVEVPTATTQPVYSEKLYKGDIINAAIEEPTKASDNEYNYSFAGWYTKNADGSWGSEVDLDSAVVSSNLTLYARFKSTKRFYTVTFMSYTSLKDGKGEGEYEYKSLMGAIGDEVAVSFKPTMAADEYNTYEFKGWTPSNSTTVVDKIEVSAAQGDATYYAKFEAKAKKVVVTFVNYDNSYLGMVEIKAGEDAVYTGATPVKAPDAKNHYTFKGWDSSLTGITKDTVIKAQYTEAPHSWKADKVTQKADCDKVELTDFKCEFCTQTKNEQTAPALGHSKSEPALGEDGYYVVTCTRCGTELDKYKATYDVKFVDEDKFTVLALESVAPENNPVYKGKAPTKKADAQYTYTFAGFIDEDGVKYPVAEDGTVTVKKPTKDETYTAYYTGTTRTYRVTYVDGSNNVLQTKAGLSYGAVIPAYEGDTAKIPVPKFNNYVHFVFEKWSVDATATITGDLVIRPVFKEVEHTLVESGSTAPTCTDKGGKGQKCSANCGYQFTDGTVPALGHNYIIASQADPTDKVEGYITYVCTRCQDTYTEKIPVKDPIIINVNVKDTQGRPVEGARVQLYLANTKIDEAVTNANGTATFKVYTAGEYYVVISNIEGYNGTVEGTINVGEGENNIDTGDELGAINIIDCACACHRDGFWGMLFRFFHKIIKLFMGKYICCSCPDESY